jgi:hypothetical protein
MIALFIDLAVSFFVTLAAGIYFGAGGEALALICVLVLCAHIVFDNVNWALTRRWPNAAFWMSIIHLVVVSGLSLSAYRLISEERLMAETLANLRVLAIGLLVVELVVFFRLWLFLRRRA